MELSPAGTRLHARLVGMEEVYGSYFRLSLQFESIELKGVAVPLRATPDLHAERGKHSDVAGFRHINPLHRRRYLPDCQEAAPASGTV